MLTSLNVMYPVRNSIFNGGFLHHAEIVAIGILQLDEVIIGLIRPRIRLCAEFYQPLHLAFLVTCVKVDVQSISFS
jgi:hypothetical protein